MNLTVHLDSPCLESLRVEAMERGVSVEQLAGAILQDHARSRGGRPVADPDAFRRATDGTYRDHDALYQRLAQ